MSGAGYTSPREALADVAKALTAFDAETPPGGLLGPRILLTAVGLDFITENVVQMAIAVELLWRANQAHRNPTLTDGEDAAKSPTLLGDMLLAESYRLLSAHGVPWDIKVLAVAMASAAEGALCVDDEEKARLQSRFHAALARVGAKRNGAYDLDTEALCERARQIGYAHLLGQRPPPGTEPFIVEAFAVDFPHSADA